MEGILTIEGAERFVQNKQDDELVAYLKENSTRRQKEIFTDDDYKHITHCLKDLVAHLFGLYPAGDLQPILENNLFQAVGACDGVNILALNLYVKFLYNNVPASLLAKMRKK